MSKPTAERIHRKKLKRLRKRKAEAALHRAGIEKVRGRYTTCDPYGFTTRPR